MTPTPPDQPEDAAIRRNVNNALPAYCDKEVVDIVTKLVSQAVQAAYDRGYNTGWIKSKRSHTPSKLISAAKQLEIIATNLRQTAATQPPAADTTKQGEGE